MPGIDTNTVLMLHFDGDGASFFDESEYAQTVIASGSVSTDKDEKKFGESSLSSNGDGSYVSVIPNTAFDFSSNGMTVDFWANISSGVPRFFSWYDDEDNFLSFSWRKTIGADYVCGILYVVEGLTVIEIEWDSSETLAGWKHYAIERDGETITLYLDGSIVGNGSIGVSQTIDPSNWTLRIGMDKTWSLDGWIDEFRISKKARYESSLFAPRSSAYTPAWSASASGLSNVRNAFEASCESKHDRVLSVWLASSIGSTHVLGSHNAKAVGESNAINTLYAEACGKSDVVASSFLASTQGSYNVNKEWSLDACGKHDVCTVYAAKCDGIHFVHGGWVADVLGDCDVSRTYISLALGKSDILSSSEYRLYRGSGQLPDFSLSPYETFASLPHTTPSLPDGEWWFVLRYVNSRGIESPNVNVWKVIVDAGLTKVALPSQPKDITIASDATIGNLVRVRAVYEASLDTSAVRADTWSIWSVGGNPTAPTPSRVYSTLNVSAMSILGGVAYLDVLIDTSAIGVPTEVAVDVAATRSGTPNVHSLPDVKTVEVDWSAPSSTYVYEGFS